MWYWLFKYVFMGPLLTLLGRPESRRAGTCSGLRRRSSWPVITWPSPTASTCRWWSGAGSRSWPRPSTSPAPASRAGSSAGSTRPPGRCRSTAPTPTRAQAALTTAERMLERGQAARHVPRGHPLARRHGCTRARPGMARLALETGVPVIPVAMIGTDVVNPPGSKMWRFGRVEVRFGKPMDFSRFEGLAGNRFIERAVIDEVMYELMRLSGQEYVDLYAADVKEGQERPLPQSSLPQLVAGSRCTALSGRGLSTVGRGARGHRPGDHDHGERPPHVGTTDQLAPQRRRGLVVFGHQRIGVQYHQRHAGGGDRAQRDTAVPVGDHAGRPAPPAAPTPSGATTTPATPPGRTSPRRSARARGSVGPQHPPRRPAPSAPAPRSRPASTARTAALAEAEPGQRARDVLVGVQRGGADAVGVAHGVGPVLPGVAPARTRSRPGSPRPPRPR